MSDKDKSIIFFDGVCGLCNRFVDWVIKRDTHGLYTFAPVQGETARQYIGELPGDEKKWAIYFYQDGQLYDQSTAVYKILIGLGGGWAVLGKLKLMFPKKLEDWKYRLVARNRYKWFGKRDTCRLPTPEERTRFLP